MTVDRPVDDSAIFFAYALRWRYSVLFLIAVMFLALGNLRAFDRPLDRKMDRLRITTYSQDPQIAQAAQQAMTTLERSWRYRFRRVIRWTPSVIGLGLLIPGLAAALRARRRVAWAKNARCVGCGYDLRGSGVRNRCPECRAPPAPRKDEHGKSAIGHRHRLGRIVASLLGFALLFYSMMNTSGCLMLGIRAERQATSAFASAPFAIVRHGRVVDTRGTMQFSFACERDHGLFREERWVNGALVHATVFPSGGDPQRFIPATGIQRHVPLRKSTPHRSEYPGFESRDLPLLSSMRWDAEKITTDGPHEVYRRRSRAGLHDHHARSIDIAIFDKDTRRPRFEWSGSFEDVLDPRAVPPLSGLWVTEITYPDDVEPALRDLSADAPGLLRADLALYPDWLDPEWVHPVIDD